MDRKLRCKVMKNCPDKKSQEELDCAAWLIKHGFANGDSQPDMTKTGNHTFSVKWEELTPEGEKALIRCNIIGVILSSKFIAGIIMGIIVTVASHFIISYIQDTAQKQTQSHKQQQQ